ncbi:MAG TPA: GDSL-type esterase/lipase family protein [Thermoanaerobaculia bacterium]|nr:GDSL-type esterase/lipase family protein [Thermoanaerobaculia bacterium]
MRSTRQARAARFLALGDSYTVGEGVARDDAWPSQLVLRLRAERVAVEDPLVIARTGWTCDELLRELRAALPSLEATAPYELVTLLVGVNDQYRGRTPLQSRPHFVALLEEALRLAGDEAARVVVLSVPDWSTTPMARDRDPAAIAAAIDELNQVQRGLALDAGAHWIDVTPLGRARVTEPDFLAADGLHPSARTYGLWVEHMLPVARRIL